MRILLPALAVALAACAPDGVAVRMDFDGAELYDAPLNSDHRLRADGTVDLSGYPNPFDVQFVDDTLQVLSTRRGFGVTAPVLMALDAEVATGRLVDVWDTDASAFLIAIDPASPAFARRVPVDVEIAQDGGPYGAWWMLSMVPLQGVPLEPETTYAAVVLRDLVQPPLAPMPRDVPDSYDDAVRELDGLGYRARDIAGLAVFTTGDPAAELHALVEAARAAGPLTPSPLALVESWDRFCVFAGEVDLPVFQQGEPPFSDGGGAIVFDGGAPVQTGTERSRVFVTIPRGRAMPDAGWPTVAYVRTGGGGDRPLVDRGHRAEAGGSTVPGSGPANWISDAGWAAIQVDGPHGGLRNVTGGDEQFLMFNITNPGATVDNFRQAAAEYALLPDLLATLTVDTTGCEGGSGGAFDADNLAIFGHSMGATMAPLSLAVAPRYRAAVLSGAGSSYIANIVYKRSPLEVRPLAEAVLRYPGVHRELHEHDPFLALLQWAAEAADPPTYASALAGRHVLMHQGIVDTYILPPIANPTTLSLGLDLAGPALDEDHPDLQDFRPIAPLLSLVSRTSLDFPVQGNQDGLTRVVVQQPEDPIEDGHEALFQTEPPQHQTRCFLADLAEHHTPTLIEGGALADPCN